MSPPRAERYTFFYDDDCGFCTRLARRAAGLGLRIVPLASREAQERLGFMSEEERLASSHLVTPEGMVYSGAHGMLVGLAVVAPRLLPILWAYRGIPGLAWILEDAYRWVARNRYLFGGSCGVNRDAS